MFEWKIECLKSALTFLKKNPNAYHQNFAKKKNEEDKEYTSTPSKILEACAGLVLQATWANPPWRIMLSTTTTLYLFIPL